MSWFCEADLPDVGGDTTPQAQVNRRLLFGSELEHGQNLSPELTPKDIAKALPMSAVRKRIERLMKPKADGTYKVPEELVQEWKRGDQTKILDEFRASGLDKDRPTLAGHSLL